MIDKLKNTLQQAGSLLKEQAGNIGDSAKEKVWQLIEEWVRIIPKLEECGLSVTSFGSSISISPTLEVEMVGKHADFTKEKLYALLDKNKTNTPLRLVFNTLKTTYNLHKESGGTLKEPLILKIRVGLSPEIRVFFGEPRIM
ncbi:MAG: hypothetical protein D6714_21170 [Bacteroidetes bacterium]|nr:MAG: hypothetical protein D6714_21170 [Bacteroidota bacterium]